jgi:hypothetical protein
MAGFFTLCDGVMKTKGMDSRLRGNDAEVVSQSEVLSAGSEEGIIFV